MIAATNLAVGQELKTSGNAADVDAILKNIDQFSKSYMDEDYEALARAYAPDARILPPSADIIRGRQAIKKRWQLPADVDVPLHKITPTEITINGNYAYDVGYYEGRSRKAGKEYPFKGKYVIVWKKIEGQWKIYMDIWNSVSD